MTEYGTITAPATLSFERLLPGPVERLWEFLVEPAQRRLWLADGPMTLVPGGDVELSFRNAELSPNDAAAPEKYRDFENCGEVFGQVIRCEAPHRLVFTWSDMPGEPEDEDTIVSITLTSDGGHVHLALTHTKLWQNEMLSIAAGWHTHLGILEDLLEGREPRPFWRTHARVEADYAERLYHGDNDSA